MTPELHQCLHVCRGIYYLSAVAPGTATLTLLFLLSRFEESLPHFCAGLEVLSRSLDTWTHSLFLNSNNVNATGVFMLWTCLRRYEEKWFLLHNRTKDCAQAAEVGPSSTHHICSVITSDNVSHFCVCQVVDGDIVMMSAHWERRRTALAQLLEQLQSLPAFSCELDAITANIGMFLSNDSSHHISVMYATLWCPWNT